MPQGGIVTTFADITERVAAASALERANETLERRVRERTAEITTVNKALAEAKSKADEANLDKTRFLAAASHDILQPLNAARLYTTSLVERSPPAEYQHLARNIDASLESVEDILNALLDISRLDTGALKPEITSFAIGELLQQLKVEFQPQAMERGLDLTVMPCRLHVRSDRRLMRRVLQNFLSNAIKYTGHGRVLLGCRRRGDTLSVELHDTGPGIPQSKHELIFKEFQRLNAGPATVPGIGLGLSIVQRIGRMLDHPIQLVSRLGSGSAFGITLPLSTAAASSEMLQPPPNAPAWSQLTGCVALCIDNEPAILDGMRSLLENWQCRVLQATDSEQAAAVIAKAGVVPDIVLVDYHLERETGIDCMARIRRLAGYDIPAVLITADRLPGVETEARANGMQLLRKPIKPAALRALMSRLHTSRLAAE
jgi:signal transduction histidine kinase/CheY-like chemotaxis protein